MLKEIIAGFGLEYQLNRLLWKTLTIITQSNFKALSYFSLKEQNVLSLFHSSTDIQKIVLNDKIFASSFVPFSHVFLVVPINCFIKVIYCSSQRKASLNGE
jgi:hypothetical protein